MAIVKNSLDEKSEKKAESGGVHQVTMNELPDNSGPVKAGTDGKAAPSASAAKPEEKKPTEPVKAATDSKAPPATPPAKPEEKKPTEPVKAGTDSKAAPVTPAAKQEEKKPAEPVKAGTDSKAAPSTPAAKAEEKKPAEPVKAGTDEKAAPATPAAKPEEKKPAEPVKAGTDSKAAPATPAAKPEEKKPAEPVKAGTDSKAAPVTPAAKQEEKKPTEPVKAGTDSKAAPATPAAKQEEKKPAEPVKTGTDGKAAPAAPAAKTDDKPPFDVDEPKKSPAAPAEVEPAIDPKLLKLDIGITETDTITMMPLPNLHPFEGHPFKVEDNEDMMNLVESIKQNGVMEPAVVIPRKEGGFEIVSGHRRMRACQLAGLETMPVIVRNLDRDEATISMVDANLKRENISPMEKARAYEMKLEAMKRKAGRRSKMDILTGAAPVRADEELAAQVGESRATIQRFTRLTKLEPELQQMVDEKKLPVNTAADISYMKPSEQKELAEAIKREAKVPSGAQAAEMKKESQAGKLTSEKINSTVAPTKKEKDPELKVTFTNEELRPYFPEKLTTVADVKRDVFNALDLYKKAMERKNAKSALTEDKAGPSKTEAPKAADKAAPGKSAKAPSKPNLKR